MNIYYMPKQKKDYKHIAMIEQKFARIIQTISFVVLAIIASLLQLNIY